MKKIFTTKVSVQSRNPTFSYPIIRLPRDLKELAGQIVNIYETEIEGVRGFFVVPYLANLAKLDKSTVKNGQSQRALQSPLFHQSTQKKRWARGDSNARPSPCKGDVITS
jgi:hypothetical protein